jgi:hypothetical protein
MVRRCKIMSDFEEELRKVHEQRMEKINEVCSIALQDKITEQDFEHMKSVLDSLNTNQLGGVDYDRF